MCDIIIVISSPVTFFIYYSLSKQRRRDRLSISISSFSLSRLINLFITLIRYYNRTMHDRTYRVTGKYCRYVVRFFFFFFNSLFPPLITIEQQKWCSLLRRIINYAIAVEYNTLLYVRHQLFVTSPTVMLWLRCVNSIFTARCSLNCQTKYKTLIRYIFHRTIDGETTDLRRFLNHCRNKTHTVKAWKSFAKDIMKEKYRFFGKSLFSFTKYRYTQRRNGNMFTFISRTFTRTTFDYSKLITTSGKSIYN